MQVGHPFSTTPILTLGGATRDPGLMEGDSDYPGDRKFVTAEPVMEIEGARRTAGDPTEFSNSIAMARGGQARTPP